MWKKQKRLLAEQDRLEVEWGGRGRDGEAARVEVEEVVDEKREKLAVVEVHAGGVL